MFLSRDVCFVESDGAAPPEAQIPAPLLLLALGLWLGQAGSQPGDCSTGLAAVDLWACLLDAPFHCPCAMPSLKLPATLALLVIPLAMKPWGLAASSGQGFSQSYLVRATQGGQQLAWLDKGYRESQDMRPEPS